MNIRHLEERDYVPIITVIDEWVAGSPAFHMHLGFEVERVTGQYRGTPCTLD